MLVVLVTAVAGTLDGRQTGPSMATTAAAIAAHPAFFHNRSVSISATPVRSGGLWTIETGTTIALAIQPASGQPPNRLVEFRGVLTDPTRLLLSDPRRQQLRPITDVFGAGRSTGKSTLLVLASAVWFEPAPSVPVAMLRQVVLNPGRWNGQVVTVRGRFRGQNLFDELPPTPLHDLNDFVLQVADAAIWVTGIAPRGARFDFDTRSRADTGRWLEVTGTVQVEGDRVRLAGSAVEETSAGPESVPAPPPPVFRLPRPVVVFSAPVNRDIDVDPRTTVRIQFSRDLKETSVPGQVVVTYLDSEEKPPAMTVRYRVSSRSIEIRFAVPLRAGATVVVTLGDGITALDGSPLQPAELRFDVRPAPDRALLAAPVPR